MFMVIVCLTECYFLSYRYLILSYFIGFMSIALWQFILLKTFWNK